MKNEYEIDIKSLCRTDELGERFYLPYSEELNKAVLLLNKLCSDLVLQNKKDQEEEYINDLIRIYYNNASFPSTESLRYILRDAITYGRENE